MNADKDGAFIVLFGELLRKRKYKAKKNKKI